MPTARVTWNLGTDPDLAGHRIYFGPTSGNYTDPASPVLAAGAGLTERLITVPVGRMYFAVTAYDLESPSLESGASAEVFADFVGTSPPGVTVSVSPTTVLAGGTVTASWSNIPAPTPTDWIGLYPVAAPDLNGYIEWNYVNGTKNPTVAIASGAFAYPVPSGAPPGLYELRLFSAAQQTNPLAISNPLTVTAATPPPPPTGLHFSRFDLWHER